MVDAKTCRRCNAAMEIVTRMTPNKFGPGLIVWCCPQCDAADSDLVHGYGVTDVGQYISRSQS
jgi:hypothetical protein